MKRIRINQQLSISKAIRFQEERLHRYLEAAGEAEDLIVIQVCFKLAEMSLQQLGQLQSVAEHESVGREGPVAEEEYYELWSQLDQRIGSNPGFEALFLIYQIERRAFGFYTHCLKVVPDEQVLLTAILMKHRRQLHSIGQALTNLICQPN